MQRVDRSLKILLLALAVAFGSMAAAGIKAAVLGLPEMIDCLVGTAILMTGAFVARAVLRRTDPNNPYRNALLICRKLRIRYRLAAAAAILAAFLLFDRFLDGDPRHFRLFSFVAPIMISTIIFDLKPGLFIAAVSTLAVDLLLIPPMGSFVITSTRDIVEVAAFAMMATILAVVVQLVVDQKRSARPVSTGNSGIVPQSPAIPHDATPINRQDLYKLFNIRLEE